MKLINSGKVTNGAEGTSMSSCTFPGVCVLPGGNMIASFKASPQKGPLAGQNGYLCYSSDMGETWSAPTAPFPGGFSYEGRRASVRGVYTTFLGGSRVLLIGPVVYEEEDKPFFNEETEGILDTDIIFAHSEDSGRAFGPPQRMPTEFCQPVPLTGPALKLSDGSLLCQFELNKTYFDTGPWLHSAVMTFSYDDGYSWGGTSLVTSQPDMYYWDQRPGVMRDGRVLNMFWTFDRIRAEYLTIHAADSVDGGKTWSPLWDTGLIGQPGAPADIGDGRVAAIHIDRTGPPRIIVRVSEDGGHTFLPEELIVYDSNLQKQEVTKSGMNDAWNEMSAFSVGHPGLVMLPTGELFAYYYAGPHTDRTDICWAKIGV